MPLVESIIKYRKIIFGNLIPVIFTGIIILSCYILFLFPIKLNFEGKIKMLGREKYQVISSEPGLGKILKKVKNLYFTKGKGSKPIKYNILAINSHYKTMEVIIYTPNKEFCDFAPSQNINFNYDINLWNLIL